MRNRNTNSSNWSTGTSSLSIPQSPSPSFRETPFNWQSSSISNSYNRIGGGGNNQWNPKDRMAELESASMRLGAAAAKRKAGEQAREYYYQSRLQAQRAMEER